MSDESELNPAPQGAQAETSLPSLGGALPPTTPAPVSLLETAVKESEIEVAPVKKYVENSFHAFVHNALSVTEEDGKKLYDILWAELLKIKNKL